MAPKQKSEDAKGGDGNGERTETAFDFAVDVFHRLLSQGLHRNSYQCVIRLMLGQFLATSNEVQSFDPRTQRFNVCDAVPRVGLHRGSDQTAQRRTHVTCFMSCCGVSTCFWFLSHSLYTMGAGHEHMRALSENVAFAMVRFSCPCFLCHFFLCVRFTHAATNRFRWCVSQMRKAEENAVKGVAGAVAAANVRATAQRLHHVFNFLRPRKRSRKTTTGGPGTLRLPGRRQRPLLMGGEAHDVEMER